MPVFIVAIQAYRVEGILSHKLFALIKLFPDYTCIHEFSARIPPGCLLPCVGSLK
jgi:hypothetical protein